MQTAQERIEPAPHHRALRRDLEMTACLGTVDAAAAEKRSAQICRATAFPAQERSIRSRTQRSPVEEAEPCEERRDALARSDVDDVGTAAQLRRALHCDRRLNRAVHRVQEADHAARDGSIVRGKAQSEAVRPVRHHRRAHAQERSEFCRLTAGAVGICARERIFYIRSKRRHISAPENRRSCA